MRQSANFKTLRPLSTAEILKRAPSVFSQTKCDSRSSSYQVIPTFKILEQFEKTNLVPVLAQQTGEGIKAKHRITFADKYALQQHKLDPLGGLLSLVSLTNSYDGSSCYELDEAGYRAVCSNGLMVANNSYNNIKIKHSGHANIAREVIEGSFEVIKAAGKSIELANDMHNIKLNNDERLMLAQGAQLLRWEENDTKPTPAQLLLPRRYGDNSNDLWTTFNVLQEHVIKGGDTIVTVDAQTGERKQTTTKEIKAIDNLSKTNKALWQMAEMLKQYKTAA